VRPSGPALDDAGDDAEIGLQTAAATFEAETAPLAALTARPEGAVAGPGGLEASDDGAMPGHRLASHSRRRGRRSASTPPGSTPSSGLAGKHPMVARGLLMTPWFAAATGFVIAASLWIYSPRPQLTYPAISVGKVPCQSSACRSHFDQQGAGRLAIKSGERVTQQHKSAAPATTSTRRRASAAASGFTFGYIVRRNAPGNFELTVSVTGQRAVKNWNLAFVLPGDQIRFVLGAHWRANGSDGGTASPLAGDQDQYGSGGHGGDHRHNDGGAPGQFRVSFEVVASGTRAVIADCSFDGASCTFRELSSPIQGVR
jgi:hypothetical protein